MTTEKVAATPAPNVAGGSPDRFGYEWSHYSTILPESRQQLQRWLGKTTIESFQGKTVLDVGCGMGRNPFWMLKGGAGRLVAVDVDEGSLAAARKNLGEFSNAKVMKCSVYDLNSDIPGEFDVVTCIGVLHHLSEPEEALQKLWSCVKPGGNLILWCYGKQGNRWLLPLIQSIRAVASRLPLPATHVLAKGLTIAFWPLLHFFPWKTDYYRYIKSLSFKNLESIIFDQILPKISNYWTKADMQRLVSTLTRPAPSQYSLDLVQENSWSLKITKP